MDRRNCKKETSPHSDSPGCAGVPAASALGAPAAVLAAILAVAAAVSVVVAFPIARMRLLTWVVGLAVVNAAARAIVAGAPVPAAAMARCPVFRVAGLAARIAVVIILVHAHVAV